jgi:TrmH RNA methyltransferase
MPPPKKKPPARSRPTRPGPPGRPREPAARTETVFGLSAARAVLAARPGDVRQIAHIKEVRTELGELLRTAAKHRIAYREVPRDELERIADSVHHEGICLLVVARRSVDPQLIVGSIQKGGFVLALDGVENPHNVGAILRSAAYFGARGLLVGGTPQRGLTPAMVRVAEGGAEHVPVCFVPELAAALDALRSAGARVFGADAHRGSALSEVRWPERSVLVLGSERDGLTAAVRKRCHDFVQIPGSGVLDSLNVSVAAGVLLAACAAAERT